MNKIPKKIHYCWVGDAPKPESVLYCIESWKKFCPDYEIIEWNENNYDFTKNKYMKEAYDSKKWGFVPDYARLDIIYEHGGIYLDTDVELVKSLDELLVYDAFMGFENTGTSEMYVNCGHGFGAKPKHNIIMAAKEVYDHISFINDDNSLNMIPSPQYTTQTLRQFGLRQINEDQNLKEMIVFASDVLCPKNFKTGNINITKRTLSIHHFTASWLDEKIKKEMKHQQDIKMKFGETIGAKLLYLESVLKKYSVVQILVILPKKILHKIKKILINIYEWIPYYFGIINAKCCRLKAKNEIAILDTSLSSDNCGDQIIMENCRFQLSSIMEIEKFSSIPTHVSITDKQRNIILNSKYKLLCGTNILSGNMSKYGLWKLTPDINPYLGTILMGVGFDSTSSKYDLYTKLFFKTILSKKHLHSVRDSFAEKKLKEMGINNVINTGCPTMWKLNSEHCSQIPVKKSQNVICTITDYSRDYDNDKKMIEILAEEYNKVYLWIQGKYDLEYVKELGVEGLVEIVSNTLENYDEILNNTDLDYVGTRLHAGIRALSFKHRSLIISIDNRAACIANDTGLPVIKREDIGLYLKDKIKSEYKTNIKLQIENIEKWKKQFSS